MKLTHREMASFAEQLAELKERREQLAAEQTQLSASRRSLLDVDRMILVLEKARRRDEGEKLSSQLPPYDGENPEQYYQAWLTAFTNFICYPGWDQPAHRIYELPKSDSVYGTASLTHDDYIKYWVGRPHTLDTVLVALNYKIRISDLDLPAW